MKKAFTLAEVLITLAIIGVVAAITIPSVIVNTNQMEFKTGLRKAVSVLNQAITMNKALTGESPYDNSDLYNYLRQYMAVMGANIVIFNDSVGTNNYVFYTTDGMRYEFPQLHNASYDFPLYENPDILLGKYYSDGGGTLSVTNRVCGSLGLSHNPDNTTMPPCIVVVDVNGDRKPSPTVQPESITYDYNSSGATLYMYPVSGAQNLNKKADPNGRLLSDVFSIMITDQGAIPYGVVAQKAMYQAQK